MNKKNKKSSFALLYTIFIMFMVMLSASAIAFSSLSSVRRFQKDKSSLGALMAAQSGLEIGITNPTDNCSDTSFPANNLIASDPSQGVYLLRMCPNATPNKYIESTGKYKGTQIKLRAENYDGPNIKVYQMGT